MNLFNIENKIALVTGGGGLLSGSMVEYLLKQGATVIILHYKKDLVDETVKRMQWISNKVNGFVCNVVGKKSLQEVSDTIIKKHEKIDVLINDVGCNMPVLDCGHVPNCFGRFQTAVQHHVLIKLILPKMIRKFVNRIDFLHLRNVKREAYGNFYEDNHLEGSSDMYEVVKAVLEVEKQRNIQLPIGHQMLHDLNNNKAYAGYTAIGRLRGLDELRGLALGISKSLK